MPSRHILIVASCNRTGAHLLTQRLRDAGARVAMIRALDADATERMVAALWAWGVL